MTVPFKNIPANIRVPGFYAEVDPSQANTGTINQRGLIVAQLLAAGTAAAGVPLLSQGPAADRAAFGQGSMAALMVDAWRKNDNFGELWVLPLADDGAAVAATGSLAFTGTATAAGVVSAYIAGVRVQAAVTVGMTAAQVATALGAAIAAINDLPATAVVVSGAVNLTAKNKGPGGNEIDLRLNYFGTAGGEATPAGLGVTVTAMAAGATAPSLTTPFANLGDMPFDFIAFPYTDTTSLNAVKALLDDVTGRWSWDRQVYGGAFAAFRGTVGAITTFGTGRNDPHVSVMGFNDSPTPAWLWAASYAAAAAVSLRADPGLPFKGIPLVGVLAPPIQSRFVLTDRNTLLFDGISTFTVAIDGTVGIELAITTYQQNTFGQPDNSFLKVQTLYLLAFSLRFLATRITSKYARFKLADDGTKFASGANIVTPSIIRADQIAAYRELEAQGIVQNGDAFKAALIVERNPQNRNRIDVLWPGDLINQLDIFALLAQFRL